MPYSILVYWFIAAWVALLAAPAVAQICTADSDTPAIAIELLGGACLAEPADAEAPIVLADAAPVSGVGATPSVW